MTQLIIATPNQVVQFQLATGEVVQVGLHESGLGVEGYRLKIVSNKGLLAALPSSGNSVELATIKSLEAEQEAFRQVVKEREQQRAAGADVESARTRG